MPKETMYQCGKCGEFDNADTWNNHTKSVYGNNITDIEQVDLKHYQQEHICFDCPNCLETCFVEDGQIKAVKDC